MNIQTEINIHTFDHAFMNNKHEDNTFELLLIIIFVLLL